MALKCTFVLALIALINIGIHQVHSKTNSVNGPSNYPFYTLIYAPPAYLIDADYSVNKKIVELAAIHNIPQNGLYQIYELIWRRFASSSPDTTATILTELAEVISSEREFIQSPANPRVNSQVPHPKLDQYLSDDSSEPHANMLRYFDTQIPQLSAHGKARIGNLVISHVPHISSDDVDNLIFELDTCIRYMLANEDMI